MANVRDMGSPAKLGTKSIIVNGTYNASSDNLDGYSQVEVDVPQEATLGTKSITANGTYNASSDSLDGYSQVNVDVEPSIDSLSVTINGTYTAPSGTDGYSPVVVAVEPNVGTKSITANGTYNASSDSLDGYSQVSVAVAPNVGTKSITANGTYNASSDSLDGYSQVSVAVPTPVLGTKNITVNGTYTAAADNLDGFSAVTVAVPSGAGATITVSYSSAFYDKTMTCTKGGTTYTETTTSAGTTVFTVNDSGTWTITCDGVSRSVDVVLAYSTEMAITKTVTVYSAASDTVSFTDATGAKTVTTNTNGQGSVSITFIPNSTITFTSSYAKNPTNLSQAYSKTITMTDSITSIYVMPNNVLYWWGYQSANLASISDWVWGTNIYEAPTYQTRYVSITSSGSGKFSGVASTSTIASGKTAKAVIKGEVDYGGNQYGFLFGASSKKYADANITETINTNTIALYTALLPSNDYVCCGCNAGRSHSLYALWYE